MKVYNIVDVKKFLNRLDACEDTVKLSTESGKSYEVGRGSKAIDLANVLGKKIPSATLDFKSADDCRNMIGFLCGMQAS